MKVSGVGKPREEAADFAGAMRDARRIRLRDGAMERGLFAGEAYILP